MLKEIHSWWTQNLRDAASARSEPSFRGGSSELQEVVEPILFEVYLVENGVSQLLCSRACLHDDWHETASPQLFMCKCAETSPRHARVENISRKQCLISGSEIVG